MTFTDRVLQIISDRGPLCVGIDPHPELLRSWKVSEGVQGLFEFTERVVEVAAFCGVGFVKPQVAFYERFGSEGYGALAFGIALARANGLFVIADVKRGDVGSTVDAYGEAWLGDTSNLQSDAMTAVAYQGIGSLDSVFERARNANKGVFVVTVASNPEAAVVQGANSGGRTVAARIADGLRSAGGAGGAVIGATARLDQYGMTVADLDGVPVLAPGFGAQGARLSDLAVIYGSLTPQVIASVSRSVLEPGYDELVASIRNAQSELKVAS
jgi:orotidine-5'-phosphate decarboxylase